MLKGVIFDLDGVLLSTDEYHYLAWKTIADQLGLYFDRNINNRLRGVSRMESLDIVLGGMGKELSSIQKEALATEKNKIYRHYLERLTPSDVAEDSIFTLKAIKAAGYKLAIGSSSKNTRFILDKTELTRFFDAISDGNNIQKSKPDPEVFLKAAEFISLSPGECIVVEDAHAGIEAAKAGGFSAVAIGSATTNPAADYKIGKLSDLLKILNIER